MNEEKQQTTIIPKITFCDKKRGGKKQERNRKDSLNSVRLIRCGTKGIRHSGVFSLPRVYRGPPDDQGPKTLELRPETFLKGKTCFYFLYDKEQDNWIKIFCLPKKRRDDFHSKCTSRIYIKRSVYGFMKKKEKKTHHNIYHNKELKFKIKKQRPYILSLLKTYNWNIGRWNDLDESSRLLKNF